MGDRKHSEDLGRHAGGPALPRRQFLAGSAVLGTGALLGGTGCVGPLAARRQEFVEYELNDPEHQIYSVCLQCHTSCPIKVKVMDGVAVKIDGNPFSAQTLFRPIPADSALATAARIDGKLCPKGQAGIQSLYDPYRLRRVLKRAGRRGENRWVSIPFDQAIEEIVEGGVLFSDVPGEERRHVPGLRELYRLRDGELSKQLAADAMAVGRGTLDLASFQARHRAHLDLLIDPDHPDLGPVNNQFVFLAGRIEHGRKEFSQRWLNGGFGSVNWYEHTTICEQSHHIAYEKMTEQWKGGGWTAGKHHMKPDLYAAEFVVFFGTSPFEANFGPPIMAEMITEGAVDSRLQFAVVDPRLSKTAGKAWKWVPIKPGTDAAFAYALMHWLLEHEHYAREYLESATRAAAEQRGETTWTNATWLVRIEPDGPGALLRASEVGVGSAEQCVVMRDGSPVAVGRDGSGPAVAGDLFFSGKVGGAAVKSAFRVLVDYVRARSFDEWCAECGVRPELAAQVAERFARHGRRAGAELYRGPVQHTSGYYNGQAVIALNLLAGNPDWKGGLSVGGGHWHEAGDKPGQPFPLKSGLQPGKLTAFGHRVNREKAHYEHSTLFREAGYPARRPWFPHSSNVYQEVIPSAADGYPYPIKALFLHKGTPAFSSPGGHAILETLVDLDKIPLFFACDIVVGETSMYADYVFPDTAIWERWGLPHQTPVAPVNASKVRQPTVHPLVESATVFGEAQPISMEAVMLAIAERLELPGFGRDGFGDGLPCRRGEDFYLKMVANVAAGDSPGDAVPDASAGELALFEKARGHLGPDVYDVARWRAAVRDPDGRDWWPKVVHVLNRGGRYEDFERYRRSGEHMPHTFGGLFHVYCEDVAHTRHPYTGQRFSGIGLYEPVRGYDGSVVEDRDRALHLITFKHITGGQSRTIADRWLGNVLPENHVIVNARTAQRLGLRDGQQVKLVSETNPEGVWDLRNGQRRPMVGRVKVVQGIHPDVVAVSWHYGHWAYGAGDIEVDATVVKGDPRRARGLCPNAALRLDPVLRNVGLQDLIGGSASFYDTRVDLVPA